MIQQDDLSFLWYPGSEEKGDSIDKMVERAVALQNLVNGKICADDFVDLLDFQGFDILHLSKSWDQCFQ